MEKKEPDFKFDNRTDGNIEYPETYNFLKREELAAPPVMTIQMPTPPQGDNVYLVVSIGGKTMRMRYEGGLVKLDWVVVNKK